MMFTLEMFTTTPTHPPKWADAAVVVVFSIQQQCQWRSLAPQQTDLCVCAASCLGDGCEKK